MHKCMKHLGLLALAIVASAAWADNKREFNQNVETPDYAFKEQTTSLPDYPAQNAQIGRAHV